MDLFSEDMPHEPVSRQLWLLNSLGLCSLELLIATLETMADIGWTTLPAEQQHGSLAMLHRWHREYSMESLVTRSFILQLRRLLPSRSAEEQQIAKISQKLAHLLKKQPDKISGMHMFVSQLFGHLRDRAWLHSTREVPQDMHKVIFKGASRRWAAQSLQTKADYEHLARQRAQAVNMDLQQEAEALRSQRDLLAQRLAESQEAAKPILLSQCTLEAKYWQHMDILLQSSHCRGQHLQKLRKEALTTPPPPSLAVQERLASQSIEVQRDPDMPAWAKKLATMRDHFANTVLQVHLRPGVEEFWKVVYAVQNPCYVAVSKLRLIEQFPDLSTRKRTLTESWVTYRFHCNFADNSSALDMPEVMDENLFVIPHVWHAGGMQMISHCMATPLQLFMEQLPEQPREDRAPQDKRSKTESHRDKLLVQFPWLTDLDAHEGFDQARRPSSSSVSASRTNVVAEPPPPDDKVLQEALAALEGERLDLAAADTAVGQGDFRTQALGGKWTLQHRGHVADAIQGAARGALAQDFCTRRSLPKSIRFELTAYSADACGVLARAWCHKMQYFFNIELQDGKHIDKAKFDPDLFTAYKEPTEFTALASQADATTGRLAKRIAQIRSLFE